MLCRAVVRCEVLRRGHDARRVSSFAQRLAQREEHKAVPIAEVVTMESILTGNWPTETWGEDKLKPPSELSDEPPRGPPQPQKKRVKKMRRSYLTNIIQGREIPPIMSRTPGTPFRTPTKTVSSSSRKTRTSIKTGTAIKTTSSSSKIFERRVEVSLDTSEQVQVLQECTQEEQVPVPTLVPGFDHVLFSPGVHWFKDPRTDTANFPSDLETIPPVTDFAFERLGQYVTSSRDNALHAHAVKNQRRFAGSTSSLSSLLSAIYVLIAHHRPVDTSTLSEAFSKESRGFSGSQYFPSSVRLNFKDGVYSVDSGGLEQIYDESKDRNVLLWLGTMLEKWLTLPREEFMTLMRDIPRVATPTVEDPPAADGSTIVTESSGASEPAPPSDHSGTTPVDDSPLSLAGDSPLSTGGALSADGSVLSATQEAAFVPIKDRKEAYRYSVSEKFAMRSQLDCYDSRLPGSGIFDIKTRAVVAIRQDVFNHVQNSSYTIRKMTGLWESFEKEYFDLIRSAFLKYSFQARIGNMDGIFVAHHNTARLLGFQYVPLKEMDDRLFGGPLGGERAFAKCVKALEEICEEVVSIWPNTSIRIMFETPYRSDTMKLWVEPDEWDEVSQGPKPIVGYEITSRSTIDGELVKPTKLLRWEHAHSTWQVQLSIKRIRQSPENKDRLRTELDQVKQRLLVGSVWLPEGMTPDEMALRWDDIDYGGRRFLQQQQIEAGTTAETPDLDTMMEMDNQYAQEPENAQTTDLDLAARRTRIASIFAQPSGHVLKLRRIARGETQPADFEDRRSRPEKSSDARLSKDKREAKERKRESRMDSRKGSSKYSRKEIGTESERETNESRYENEKRKWQEEEDQIRYENDRKKWQEGEDEERMQKASFDDPLASGRSRDAPPHTPVPTSAEKWAQATLDDALDDDAYGTLSDDPFQDGGNGDKGR